MDPDQERWWRREILPTLDLHPEPVIHQRIPEVLLELEELPVRAVERPLRCALGYPARRAALTLPASPGLGARLLGGSVRLPALAAADCGQVLLTLSAAP